MFQKAGKKLGGILGNLQQGLGQPQNDRFATLGANLLAQSGWQATPQSLGANLGNAMLNTNQQMMQNQAHEAQMQAAAQQAQMRDHQIAEQQRVVENRGILADLLQPTNTRPDGTGAEQMPDYGNVMLNLTQRTGDIDAYQAYIADKYKQEAAAAAQVERDRNYDLQRDSLDHRIANDRASASRANIPTTIGSGYVGSDGQRYVDVQQPDGTIKAVPTGIAVATTEWRNTPDGPKLFDRVTGTAVMPEGQTPESHREATRQEAAAKAQGTAQGKGTEEARADYQKTKVSAGNMAGLIEGILNHKDFDSVHGAGSGAMPIQLARGLVNPSTKALQRQIEQLENALTLNATDQITGPLSDSDLQLLKDSVSAYSQSQTPEDARRALETIKRLLLKGVSDAAETYNYTASGEAPSADGQYLTFDASGAVQ